MAADWHADTEWNDILRRHGIIPPRPDEFDGSDDNDKQEMKNPLDDKTVKELRQLEEDTLDDDRAIQKYRYAS